MNTIILKILCWINGIKNPFVWAYEQEDDVGDEEQAKREDKE